MMIRTVLVVGVLGLNATAFAQADWEVVASGAITVKNRSKPSSSIKEVWAEGEIAAPVQDIQAVVMAADKFSAFMPYVKESRFLGEPNEDGSRFVYTRLELPLVSSRDYVLQVWQDQGTNA